MTTAHDVLAHFGLAIGSASKRDVLAAFRAANDEGTIQATDALHLFGRSDPRLHTCMSLPAALRHLGCVDADTDAARMEYTNDTLPNNLQASRTGTANDGRMLVKIGPAGAQRDSILRDLRARLPAGWRAEVYAQTGIDAVITHVGR